MQKRRCFALLPFVLPFAAPVFAANSPPDAETTSSANTSPAVSPAAPAADDLQKQLADAQGQLSSALHSFSLLHDENTQLKEDAEKNAALIDEAQHTIAALKIQAAAAIRVDILQAQLRQSQDQLAALAAENAKLKLRLALVGAPPAGGMPVPTRPAQQ